MLLREYFIPIVAIAFQIFIGSRRLSICDSRQAKVCEMSACRVDARSHLINTSPTRARLPFRVDCIANKTQVVSERGRERGDESETEKEREY